MASAAGNRVVKNSDLTKIHKIILNNDFMLLKNEYNDVCYECLKTGKHIHININTLSNIAIKLAVPLSDDHSYFKTSFSSYDDLEKYIDNYFFTINQKPMARRDSGFNEPEQVNCDDDCDDDCDNDCDDDCDSEEEDYIVMDPIDIYKMRYKTDCIKYWHNIAITVAFINSLMFLNIKWRSLVVLTYFTIYSVSAKEVFRPTGYLITFYMASCAGNVLVPCYNTMQFLSNMLILWATNVLMHGVITRDFPILLDSTFSSIIWAPYIVAMNVVPKYKTIVNYSMGAPYFLEDLCINPKYEVHDGFKPDDYSNSDSD